MVAANYKRVLARPYIVDTIDQLPDALLELAIANLSDDLVVECIVVIPSESYGQGFGWRANQKEALIFTHNGILLLTPSSMKRSSGRIVWIPADDIFMIRLSLVLLYGKLEVFGIRNGKDEKIDVEYNTVAHHSLAPFLRRLIRRTWQKNTGDLSFLPDDDTFANFVTASYSFYNGLRVEAFQPGERLLRFVYQPEVKQPLLGIFRRAIFPQTVIALTDQQLILLQQNLGSQTHHEWIFTFIPLYRIEAINQSPYKSWQRVSIQLDAPLAQQPIELLLEDGQAEKWRKLWADVRAKAEN